MARLAVVILAAGGSSRLGRPKQFVKYRGVSLIEQSIGLAISVAAGCTIVVAGRDQHRLRRAVGGRCRVVANRRWATGMRSSLKRGLEALPDSIAAALVLTCDQPRIRSDYVRRLTERWSAQPERPVAARYLGRLGVPAILPRRYWRSVLEAAGPDQGAGPWLRRQQKTALGIPTAAAAFDVDTPSDLRSAS